MKNLIAKTALAFAVLGYIFSSRWFILFLNKLNPIQGLLFYYLQLFITLEILQWFGLVIGGVKINTTLQTIGELLVVFAFFILVDNESEWVKTVVGEETKEEQRCPKVYLQAEDGATYYLWKTLTGAPPDTIRLLTFVLTPAILVTVGLYLTGGAALRRDLLG